MEQREIDLRLIIQVAIRSWPIILAAGLLTSLAATLLVLSRKPVHSAQAEVAIVQQQTRVDFKSNITDQQAVQNNFPAISSGLFTLVKSGSVAQDVMDTLGTSLPVELRHVNVLQRMITVKTQPGSNVIPIRADSDNPDIATMVATAWANAFVKRMNAAFGRQSNVATVQAELDDARQNYQAKEKDLATSTLPREIGNAQREAGGLAIIINNVRSAQLAAITSILEIKARERTNYLRSYITSEVNGASITVDAVRASQTGQLGIWYQTQARLKALRGDIEALRNQVKQGSAAGTGLAYSLLQSQLFAGSTPVPGNIQLQAAAGASGKDAVTTQDLDILLANTDVRLKQLQDQITTLSAALENGKAYTLPDGKAPEPVAKGSLQPLDQSYIQPNTPALLQTIGITGSMVVASDNKLQELEARLDQLTAEQQQKQGQLFVVTQEVDIAKARYTALSTRLGEIAAAATGNDAVVRVVGPGTITAPASRNTILILLGSLVSGLLLGTLFVVGRKFVAMMLADNPSQQVRQPAL